MRFLKRKLFFGIMMILIVFLICSCSFLVYSDFLKQNEIIKATYNASAVQAANKIALFLKIKDKASIIGYFDDTLLLGNTQYINIYSENDVFITIPDDENKRFSCSNSPNIVPISLFDKKIGKLEYCLESLTKPKIIPISLMLILLVGLFIITLILGYFFINKTTFSISNFLNDINNIDISNPHFPKEPDNLQCSYTEQLYGSVFNLIEKLNIAIRERKENEKLAAIGQTASILAHDVRKPFTSMKSMLSMIDKIKDNPSSMQKAKATVDETITHAESMISDILDFSREVEVETSPNGLSGLIDFSVRQAVQGKKDIFVTFEYNIENNLKPFADNERMVRVFVNIIGNAIEALKSYGNNENKNVWFYAKTITKNENNCIEIVIGNNGPQIPDEDIENLFESFFTKGKKSGTGLGLASAHKIVTLHNGTIEARNVDNRVESKSGVEFVITIPASDEIDEHNLEVLPKNTDEILFVKYEPLQEDTDEKLSFLEKQKKIKVVLLEDETLYRAFVRNTIEENDILSKVIRLYDADKVDACIELVKKESIDFAKSFPDMFYFRFFFLYSIEVPFILVS
ncbi:MAG: ATP-binding protein [Pseudomonadota bacterium]